MTENDELLEQFEKKFEHDGTSQKLEVSLDKRKYKKVPVIEVSLEKNRTYEVADDNPIVLYDFGMFPTVTAEGFGDKLLNGERPLWYACKGMPFPRILGYSEAVAMIALLFWLMAEKNGFAAFFILQGLAVLISVIIRSLHKRFYAFTDKRIMINENYGDKNVKSISLYDITGVTFDYKLNGRTDVSIFYRIETELNTCHIKDFPDADSLKTLLEQIPRIKIKENSE